MRNYKEIKPLNIHSYAPLESIQDFFSKVNELGYINIVPTNVTKTRLSTSVYVPGFKFGINRKSRKFNVHEEISNNFYTFEKQANYYFKISKHQQKLEYLAYIEEVLDELEFPKNIEVRIENNTFYKRLK